MTHVPLHTQDKTAVASERRMFKFRLVHYHHSGNILSLPPPAHHNTKHKFYPMGFLDFKPQIVKWISFDSRFEQFIIVPISEHEDGAIISNIINSR